jgi:hypothetical protein
METLTATKKATQNGLESLRLLDIPVQKQPIFNQNGVVIPGFIGVTRTDTAKTLAIVSDRYELVGHKAALDPILDKMHNEGWKVSKTSVEKFGAKAYVELIDESLSFEVKTRQVGDIVNARLTLQSTLDGTSKIRATYGLWRLRCTNGLSAPSKESIGFAGRHNANIYEALESFGSKSENYRQMFLGCNETFNSLANTVVDKDVARKLVEQLVGQRRTDQVLGYWIAGKGQDGTPSAWALYNGITEYLTHDFKGGVALSTARTDAALQEVLKLVK